MDHRELKMSEKEPHYQGGQDRGLTPGHLSVEAVRMNKESMPAGQGAVLCASSVCGHQPSLPITSVPEKQTSSQAQALSVWAVEWSLCPPSTLPGPRV